MKTEIRKFWNWFRENQASLQPDAITDRLQRKVDQLVKKLGVPSWEIGPYNERLELIFFALSPSGNPEVFKRTMAIVENAPSIEGWVFLAAKPPKLWDRKFVWKESKHQIDASKWRFLVYKYGDGLSDIVLIDDVLKSYAETEKRNILDFVIASEIGEIGILKYVYSIDIDTNVDGDLASSSVRLKELSEFIRFG